MKELSIEEKAKRYDEAIKYGQYLINERCKENTNGSFYRADLDKMFPELAESEDERIRGAIIDIIKSQKEQQCHIDGAIYDEMIAWLEKQGTELSVYQDALYRIATILSQHEDREGSPLEQIRSIVVDSSLSAMDFEKKELKKIEQKTAKLPKGEDYGIDGLWHAISILTRTLGAVVGYQSDDGILEHKCAISAVKELYERKPAWGEEDAEMIDYVASILYSNFNENEKFDNNKPCVGALVDWLKSLKDRVQPQNTWKPSDDQLEALEHSLGDYNITIFEERHETLTSLYQDLQKLREE